MKKSTILFDMLWFLGFLAAPCSAEDKFALPAGTKVLLPEGATVGWVIPPTPGKENNPDLSSQFAIDAEGMPWFGYANITLFSLFDAAILLVDRRFDGFAWLDNGKFIMSADGSLGSLKDKPAKNADNAQEVSPTVKFTPFLPLPCKGLKVYPGRDNVCFLAGYNASTNGYEVYVVHGNDGKYGARKILAGDKPISCVSGGAAEAYMAAGRVIAKLQAGISGLQPVFRHPRQDMTSLEYVRNTGLFYTTESGVGYLAFDGKALEFLKTSRPQVRLHKGSLFVLLGGSCAVLKIDNLETFKGLGAAVETAKTKPANEILTNKIIVSMVKSGLADESIIDLINRNRVDFNLSVDSMVELSGQNVSSAVIMAMKQAMKKQSAKTP